MRFTLCNLLAAIALLTFAAGVMAEDKPADKPASGESKESRKIDLADGKLLLEAPASWERKKPKVNFIEHEFAVPATKGDDADGRITVMGAGGDLDANIERWINQFDQPDGSETKNLVPEGDRKRTINGLEVRFVDLMGTYKDSPRPFDPSAVPTAKANYRMLAAIVSAPKLGNYFFKFYGPRQTVTDHSDEFRKMIDGIEKK